MKKVLIIIYYWPPSGGAGVQRWLKLSKYLADTGVEVHVLTVDETYASYLQTDESLKNDIHPKVIVHKTKSFEPVNYYAKLVGKENVPTAGFSNVDNNNWKQKLVKTLRSNLFIPDPRRGWKKYAVATGVEVIQKFDIKTIITSSPPHSTQLIGLALQKKCGVKWIVDFRDPWTDIYYYNILGHTSFSKYLDARLEKKVVEQADQIIAVSKGVRDSFLAKSENISTEKFEIMPNGFDPKDFLKNTARKNNNTFTICYTGTISDQYEPEIFFDALQKLVEQNPETKIKFQFIGSVSARIHEYLQQLDFEFEFISTVPHSKITQYQQQADLLFLAIPNVQDAGGILTGKLFEYLGSLNSIIGIGPANGDAAEILEQCQAGKMFDRTNEQPIFVFLQKALDDFLSDVSNGVLEEEVNRFSRKFQAEQIKELL